MGDATVHQLPILICNIKFIYELSYSWLLGMLYFDDIETFMYFVFAGVWQRGAGYFRGICLLLSLYK